MNVFLSCLILLCFSYSGFGQVPPDPNSTSTASNVAKDTNEIFQYTETLPEFPGGQQAMMKFLQKNLMYPEMEKEMGVQGKVFVSFIVEKDGSVSNVTIKKGVQGGPGLEKEAVRVIKMMPNWTPGKQNGKEVRVMFNIPIKFNLDGGYTPLSSSTLFPVYPGGPSALHDYLKTNLKYPAKALKKKKEGNVILTYLVDLSGNVTEVKITDSSNKIFNEEAIRLVKEMPKWTPGKDQKTPYPEIVTVNFKLPLKK